MGKRKAKRWLDLVFALYFLGVAALQWNDPDPWLWMPLYVLFSWGCLSEWRGKPLPSKLKLTVVGAALIWGTLLWSLTPAYDSQWIEVETLREAVGLLIVALCYLMMVPLRKQRPSDLLDATDTRSVAQ